MQNNNQRRIEDYYRFEDNIGSGNFGSICKGRDIKTNVKVAIKILSKQRIHKINTKKYKSKNVNSMIDGEDLVESNLIREVSILKKCKHPHIIDFIDFFANDENYYIVMEYADNGDLFEYVERKITLPINTIKCIASQLISALEYCHSKLIAHRDIKLDNILIIDNKDDSNSDPISIKIADFGLANYISTDAQHNSFCGSVEYAAPELLLSQVYNPMDVDVWSFGVNLYTMCLGIFPWPKENMLYYVINYIYDSKKIYDLELRDLLSKIFVPASERINILKIKEHPFMKGHIRPAYLEIKGFSKIDCKIVEKVVNMGFDKEKTLASIYNNEHSLETSIYCLLLDREEKSMKDKKNRHKKLFGIVDNKKYSKSETSLKIDYDSDSNSLKYSSDEDL